MLRAVVLRSRLMAPAGGIVEMVLSHKGAAAPF
jgi:hypothetical protein